MEDGNIAGTASAPLLSICIPAYNCEGSLAACVGSIAEQGLWGCEVIVVDDGSVDGTAEMARKLARVIPALKVVRQNNTGCFHARVAALREARGEYVMSVDSDDALLPGALNALRGRLGGHGLGEGPDVLFFGGEAFDLASGKSTQRPCLLRADPDGWVCRAEVFERLCFGKSLNTMWQKVIRRSLFRPDELAVLPRVEMGEDWVFGFGAMTRARSFARLDESLYQYRMSGSSMTGAYDHGYWATLKLMCVWKATAIGVSPSIDTRGLDMNLLEEVSKAICYVPGAVEDRCRYYATLDAIRDDELIRTTYEVCGSELPGIYRMPYRLLYSGRFKSLYAVKRLATVLRKHKG